MERGLPCELVLVCWLPSYYEASVFERVLPCELVLVCWLRSYYEASVFETTIRVVGGILSAQELTGDPELLRRRAAACLPPHVPA